MSQLSRRQVTRAAAWSVPVIAVASAAPATAASDATSACPGEFAGPVSSWLSSTGFSSHGELADTAPWYVYLNLVFHSAQCGFGSDYGVDTSVSGVVVHYEQGTSTGTFSPLSYAGLNSFADPGSCEDKISMNIGSGVGAEDLFVTKITFTYMISGLPGGTAEPCTVPVTATLTYTDGVGNDGSGTVVLS